MQIKIDWAFGLLLAALFMSLSAIAANKVFTNDDINQLLGESDDFKKSHSVMIQQCDRLKAILNGFLVGDTNAIDKKSDELLKAMSKTIQIRATTHETESGTWRSVTEIVEETHLMKEEASRNDYNKAYKHFSNIAASCIQCHQVVRELGKWPTPTSDAENSASPVNKKEEVLPAPSKKSQKKLDPDALPISK